MEKKVIINGIEMVSTIDEPVGEVGGWLINSEEDEELEEWENRNWDNMTFEEAYEYFDTYYPPNGNHEAWRAYELAKEALSKQIPKKPVEGYMFSDGWREHIRKHAPEIADKTGSCCPTCGKHIGNSEQTLKKKNYFPYCHWCGQALLEPEE